MTPVPNIEAPPAHAASGLSERAKSGIGLIVVVVVALLHRLPPFLNAGAVNSDAAIVGVQALAWLERGEWSSHLWGASYQTSVEVVAAAGLFKVLGPSPWALFLVPYLGAAACVALIFLMLRRAMPASAAVIATLTVAFGSQAITSPMTYVLRQLMFLTVVLGLWLVHRASTTRLGPLQLLLGSAFFGLGIFVDVFATVMWPACALLALACCFDAPRTWKWVGARFVSVSAGLAAGLYAAKYVGHVGGAATPGLKWEHWHGTWALFTEQCLPYALSTKVWMPGQSLYPDLWDPPAAWRYFSLFAAGLLVLLWVTPLLLVFVKRIDWPMRRLGLFGFAAGSASLLGFVFSTAPTDMWSVRYLAPLMWTVPFALAPLATLFKPRGVGVLLAPYLLSAAVGGWLSWGNFVKGPLPVLYPRGSAVEEAQVIDEVLKRGCTAGGAQYWLSYRFSLLSREKLPTVPLDGPDRYPLYRAKFDAAPKVALIFHPAEPRGQPAPYEQMLKSQNARYETLHIADFTVFVWDRSAPPAPPAQPPAPPEIPPLLRR